MNGHESKFVDVKANTEMKYNFPPEQLTTDELISIVLEAFRRSDGERIASIRTHARGTAANYLLVATLCGDRLDELHEQEGRG
jgi:hypothetical protein